MCFRLLLAPVDVHIDRSRSSSHTERDICSSSANNGSTNALYICIYTFILDGSLGLTGAATVAAPTENPYIQTL